MFNHKTDFPTKLIKNNSSYHVNDRGSVFWSPDDPMLTLEFTDEWENWKLNISDLYYVDTQSLKICFKSNDDYVMFILAWNGK